MMFGMIPFSRRDDNMFDLFDNFEKNFFGSSNSSMPAFRTDIRDLGDKFLMEADGFLTIKAQHKEVQDQKDSQDQKDAQGSYIRRERRIGTFSRTFDISGIDEAGITASYTNGILALTLPKQAPVVPAARQIAIH